MKLIFQCFMGENVQGGLNVPPSPCRVKAWEIEMTARVRLQHFSYLLYKAVFDTASSFQWSEYLIQYFQ